MRDLTILFDVTTGLVADITEAIVAAGVELSAGCVFMRTEGRVASAPARLFPLPALCG
ncbi:MAG: hypothetical protein H0V96_00595 [Acidimicrobiia bacterium]|nr:hypothetical protein [Acidimicrobiia bacterium]